MEGRFPCWLCEWGALSYCSEFDLKLLASVRLPGERLARELDSFSGSCAQLTLFARQHRSGLSMIQRI